MSTESNKELTRRIIEDVLNTGRVELLDEVMDASLTAHLQRDIPALWRAFPDLHYTIEDMIAEGDQVVVRFAVAGTNRGPFQGRPPTNKAARWSGMTWSRIVDGKVVEQWITLDLLGLMQQLGVIPSAIPPHAAVEAAH